MSDPRTCLKHCPHDSGHSMASWPGQHGVVCCQCGAPGVQRQRFTVQEGHGPHAPSVLTRDAPEWRDQ